MFDKIFKGIFDSELVSVIPVKQFLLCIGVALVIGLILSLCYMYRSRYTRSFIITLALLPAVVCAVIMMVNGNIGAGVAVAGAFGLVRFRSLPGTAKEIAILFLAMCAGLICGMGYLGYAVLFSLIMGLICVVYTSVNLGGAKSGRTLSITIPEDLDYTEVFTDLLKDYTTSYELEQVRTTNMGTMFRLTYYVVLKDISKEKELVDKLRCRNGNLEIMISRPGYGAPEL